MKTTCLILAVLSGLALTVAGAPAALTSVVVSVLALPLLSGK